MKLRALQGSESAGLGECAGYAVWGEDGRIGTVLGTRRSGSSVEPSMLAVRTGLFCRRTVLVPASEVDRIDLDLRRVTLTPRSLDRRTVVVAVDDIAVPGRPGASLLRTCVDAGEGVAL